MKTLLLLPLLFLCSCAAILPGNDPVVVRAEQTVQMAEATFDTFFSVEHKHRKVFAVLMPDLHAFAENLRATAPSALATARTMTKAYKFNRNETNKAGLATAVALLETSLRETQSWLARTQRKQ